MRIQSTRDLDATVVAVSVPPVRPAGPLQQIHDTLCLLQPLRQRQRLLLLQIRPPL